MNSFSPVIPLEARRRCSRSARFMAAKDLQTLILRHQGGKWARMAQARAVLTSVPEDGEDSVHPARPDDVAPFRERVLGMNGILRVRKQLLDPRESDGQPGRV